MARISFIDTTCIYNGAPAPSGSGKSTALRMLAGLQQISAGMIQIGGVDVSRKPPKDRDIAMVFQNYAPYPRMTVAENMAYALKLRGAPSEGRSAPRIGERVGVLVQESERHVFT